MRLHVCEREDIICVLCACVLPVVFAHANGYRFPRAPYRSSTECLAMNKDGLHRITRPFINPQFQRLGICRAYYNKRAYRVMRVYASACECGIVLREIEIYIHDSHHEYHSRNEMFKIKKRLN